MRAALPPTFSLRRAARILRDGGVIAYPTEAVFGLGCLPDHAAALRRILALKGRPADAGFILIASHPRQLVRWIAPTAAEARRLRSRTGAPVTWVVTAASGVSPLVTGGRGTVAVRLTRHPVAAALCDLCGAAIVSTSANRHGRLPARRALAVRLQFGPGLDAVVAGATGGRPRPTEIRHARTGRVIRRG